MPFSKYVIKYASGKIFFDGEFFYDDDGKSYAFEQVYSLEIACLSERYYLSYFPNKELRDAERFNLEPQRCGLGKPQGIADGFSFPHKVLGVGSCDGEYMADSKDFLQKVSKYFDDRSKAVVVKQADYDKAWIHYKNLEGLRVNYFLKSDIRLKEFDTSNIIWFIVSLLIATLLISLGLYVSSAIFAVLCFFPFCFYYKWKEANYHLRKFWRMNHYNIVNERNMLTAELEFVIKTEIPELDFDYFVHHCLIKFKDQANKQRDNYLGTLPRISEASAPFAELFDRPIEGSWSFYGHYSSVIHDAKMISRTCSVTYLDRTGRHFLISKASMSYPVSSMEEI
ncbi:MAG: hypothetical protein A2X86_19650 [Bdellovibrionales bacterium GWA2_49_15]|nr:MAG: hypothetical protein A2X86_19650 [Bdellovibrionales bacterium GWA2_49_15]HAZ13793.1 hypothetical protein [Bdellovibrionales bacterium]